MIYWPHSKTRIFLRRPQAGFALFIMNSFLKKHHRPVFFIAWLIINLIQAGTTELFDDEAYYWIYSKYPAWGYFDHPPMIAILIKAGYAIFQNEFGIRFFIVLLNTATIFLVSYLIDGRNDRLFYAISTSIVVAQIGGMIAVPDVPLLFFVTLFFLIYRRFEQRMSLWNSLLLGISISLMLYTKYHGVLIVSFTLLSNIKLFTKHQTYIVAAVALLLFWPHLYWQYMRDFPSVQYHLFERNASTYMISYTTLYLLGQIILAGPFIGWLLIWAAIRYKSFTATEKALRFTLTGFYIFFMISTLKGRVEANWTVPAFVALIVLSHQHLNKRPHMAAWVYKTLPLTLLLIVTLRIYMMLDLKTFLWIGNELHQNKEWVGIISKKANGLPVVFINSYQRPSKYWFYKQEPALGMNTPDYRRNNFNFWPIEDDYFGKSVFAVGEYDTLILKNKIIAPRFRETGSAVIPLYYSFMKAQFSHIKNKVSAQTVTSSFDVKIPGRYLPYFQSSPFDTSSIQLAILNISDTIRYYSSATTVKQITQLSSRLSVDFPTQLPKGIYDARLGISSAIPGHPTLNSASFRIKVE